MRRIAPALAALALVLVLVPPADAQSGGDEAGSSQEITFYPHTFGIGRGEPMPANTEYPWGEEDFSVGLSPLLFGCGTPPPAPAGSLGGAGAEGTAAYNPSCDEATFNEFWTYTTAGFVDANSWTDVRNEDFEVQYTNFHNERGQSKDILLDTSEEMDAVLHMSADWSGAPILTCLDHAPPDVPWPVPCWNWDPGILPDWQVQATLYSGRLGPYGGEASTMPPVQEAHEGDNLKVVARGHSEPSTINSLQVTGNPTVWEIPIPMGEPQVDRIPKEHDLVMRFQWWSNTTGNRYIMPTPTVGVVPFFWNLNGGEFYPNRFTLPVENPIGVEFVSPQFVHGKLALLAIVNTPWGSYDVDPDSVTLEVRDASTGRPVTPEHLEVATDYSVAHGGHYDPFNVTWIWDYAADALDPGTYEVTVSADNWQGSASASCTATFEVEEGPSPGPTETGSCGLRSVNESDLGEYRDASGGGSDGLGLEAGSPAGPDPLPDDPPASAGAPEESARDPEGPTATPHAGAVLAVAAAAAAALARREGDP